ncbi:acyl-CoA dehydrogenase [Magnetospira sp. QH-2]|uniref:acyl-CoA dehydrogenase n=1 Tax=Magnetospira sp. (strain QH-2) TaxID=1288970 RepID=UPI0009E4C733|nr:acyl-CoA dehydrogenase [Magnetospira sp. QH-2]
MLILSALAVFLILAYRGQGYWAWVLGGLALIAAGGLPSSVPMAVAGLVLAMLVLVFGLPFLRRRLVSGPLMPLLSRLLPRMGETERIALDAGTVGWEGEMFSGSPDWQRLHEMKICPLSDEEQAFLEGPVATLCHLLDDHDIHRRGDLPPEIWDFIKRERFFGLIIPKQYGGLGFSAAAHSAVIMRLSGCSVPTAVTVMVPNSLGPAELLLAYGTEEQKDRYLMRLATGEDVPCFALTEAHAGSDAANGRSQGVVCRGIWEGKEVVGIRLSFAKRYITLAPIATVVGLAFKLSDPDGLIGEDPEPGITCALLPRETPGMRIGGRHDPMGVPFLNGPVEGEDVFIPASFIIGGPEQAGQGWRMLMETLAAGRGISLPSLAVGAAQLSTRTSASYAQVREQFGLPIGKFEGIRERLERIGGLTYAMEATRRLTVGAVDSGEKPSVASAIAKASLTEAMRVTLNDAMDIQGGAAICRGPRNILARAYASIPIGITVEGANILTRSLIVFGQGAMRCHPYLRAELEALQSRDTQAFDRALFGHLNHMVRNGTRAFMLALAPGRGGERSLSRLSAAFALIADAALISLGGAMKRKERLSGRLADAFAWLYMGSAVLKRFNDAGRPKAEMPFVHWTLNRARMEITAALAGTLANLPNRPLAWAVRWITFPTGYGSAPLTDKLADKLVEALLNDPDVLDRLTGDILHPAPDKPGLGALEQALRQIDVAAPAREKMAAIRKGTLASDALTDADRKAIDAADKARDAVIQVDVFDPEDLYL